ncbi:PAAR domain-containing protein [Duganella caerulea]|uniref:PAAR domain-containing protein n=1 Tax=Duganella caerulea TaxID=2885762 RepID=UPI004037DDC4
MPNVIRVGDPTSHGGSVLSSSVSHFTVEGKAVVVVGDKCSCPINGHLELHSRERQFNAHGER